MFWAMMYMLLFGGAGNAGGALVPEAKAFRKAISDPVRQEQVLELRDRAEQIETQRRQAVEEALDSLAGLNARHDAALEEFEVVFSDLEAARESALEALLDTRFACKEQMTRKEWTAVYGKP